ncbi:hypothetical protein [Paenibacillus sp. 1-18]|uniref:hypothetical protein n=1 Tax=Paenibacillus sp. 1-18 TaxID=1333846 RepID=UPI000470FF08|nr:hypothetical protein [Paenibacillus sp. 1-18]
MNEQEWYYKVVIRVSNLGDVNVDPEFRFSEDKKQEMTEFVFTCLENGHEVSIVHTTEEFDS